MCAKSTCHCQQLLPARLISARVDVIVGLKMQEKELEADYEIGVVLGNGGFGTVYAGTRRRDGKRVSSTVFSL